MTDPPLSERQFTLTFGHYNQTEPWTDVRSLSWAELSALLTTHSVGEKEGTCIVPAAFRGSKRQKSDADRIEVAFLDSDSGATLPEIDAAVRQRGWAAIISSTHSHLATTTLVNKRAWERFSKTCKDENAAPRAFLEKDKHYLPRIAAGAEIAGGRNDAVVIRHQPCPKFRIAIPLLKPWVAGEFDTQAQANDAWRESIEAFAIALGLRIDPACTDTSRLFYLPRRPSGGPEPETAVLAGNTCDLRSLAAGQCGLETALGAGHSRDNDVQDYVDPDTGQVFNFHKWAACYGDRFEIAVALDARRPGVFVGKVSEHRHHIRCVNEDAHTQAGEDRATFILNASASATRGFVYHCRHAHCDRLDRLFFVRQMLQEHWLAVSDLTDPAFLMPVADDSAPRDAHSAGAPASKSSSRTGRHRTVIAEDGKDIDWPEPVDFLASNEMTGAPVLRPDHLPDAIVPFVFDTAARMGVDPAAVGLAALVACASVVSDTWQLQPKRFDDTWLESPRIWGAIVGDPSILKTPVLSACTRPIDRLEIEARKQHEESMLQYKAALTAWKRNKEEGDEPRHPILKRYLVENLTTEALSEVLRDDFGARQRAPAGKVLVRSDELAELLSNLDRYNAGGRGGGDRGALLRLYNGGRHTVDRVNRGAFACPNWSACIVGGIQPGPIQKIAREAADDGMLQRFMYVVPVPQGRGVDQKPDHQALRHYDALITKLASLFPSKEHGSAGYQPVCLHAEAHEYREMLDERLSRLAAMPDVSPRLKAACGKFPGLFARLALLFHLIDIANAYLRATMPPPLQVVPAQTASKVALYLGEIVLPHLLRADAVMFLTPQTGHARWIAGFILSREFRRITRRDVTRAYGALRAPEHERELTSVMNGLVAMGWLHEEVNDNPSRPPTSWLVNPKVYTVFAARAEQERAARLLAQRTALRNLQNA